MGASLAAQSKRASKRVVVIGAGITGLACAYELVKAGNEVVVIEASGRVGGHVRTLKDPLADGLYAEVGAEHFNKPEYIQYWRYVKEFDLTPTPHRLRDDRLTLVNGELLSSDDLRRPAILGKLGLNQSETGFLASRSWAELPMLYLDRYAEQIREESDPFRGSLRKLDALTVTELLQQEKASGAVVEQFGSSSSALHAVWGVALKRMRGASFYNKDLFRLQGGNERMTQTFAERLGKRVQRNCPVTGIEHSGSGVTITYKQEGQTRKLDADYAVSAISLVNLRQIPVTPSWPEEKAHVIQEMPYTIKARVVFQSRTRFWRVDHANPNLQLFHPTLNDTWTMAEEVNTPRGILVANSQCGVTGAAALGTFLKHYRGKSADIEQTLVHDWGRDQWAGACERGSYKPAQLARFWPEVTRPFGRIHFAGAYAAPMSWGQEAALESANRVAREIDQA